MLKQPKQFSQESGINTDTLESAISWLTVNLINAVIRVWAQATKRAIWLISWHWRWGEGHCHSEGVKLSPTKTPYFPSGALCPTWPSCSQAVWYSARWQRSFTRWYLGRKFSSWASTFSFSLLCSSLLVKKKVHVFGLILDLININSKINTQFAETTQRLSAKSTSSQVAKT